jgi:hypothetical protein
VLNRIGSLAPTGPYSSLPVVMIDCSPFAMVIAASSLRGLL